MRSTPDKSETKPAAKTDAETMKIREPRDHSNVISVPKVELFKLLVRLRMEDKARTTQTDDDLTNDAAVLLTFEDGSKVSGSVEEIEAKASFTELSAYVANQVMSRKTVGG